MHSSEIVTPPNVEAPVYLSGAAPGPMPAEKQDTKGFFNLPELLILFPTNTTKYETNPPPAPVFRCNLPDYHAIMAFRTNLSYKRKL